ncbi:MAG: hypothetical protein UEK73_06740 [Acetatifactor sp.]|nr:hypothetical protein [Acetatifactor sp.]
MFTIFKEEKVITAGILVFLCLSVLVRLMLAWMYHTMIRETDNMATTGNRLLKQCKVKFANCYQLNGGVSNIPVFVDKFLNRLSFGHLSFDAWYHLSGQCMLFSVVFAGVGICKGILDGRMLGEILPFYIASFLGLYLYFSLSALVDIKGKQRVLKTNLIDYLENHLSGRIPVTEQDYERLYGASKLPGRRTVELMPIRGRAAQPQEMVRETGREVFSTEHEMPGKMEDRGMAQQDESSRVTEEELQALLQELLTV